MKALFLLLSVFIHAQSSAQQKFIEVNVADTVWAEADAFMYQINIVQDEDVTYEEFRYKNPSFFKRKTEQHYQALEHIYDSLKRALKKDGFAFLAPPTADTFSVEKGRYPSFSCVVVISSLDSLSLLYHRIKNIRYLSGSVETIKAKDETTYQKELYKKLLKQAKDKAGIIASYGNQILGVIQTVVEYKSNENSLGGFTAYPPLSALAESVIPGWHTTTKKPAVVPLVTSTPINNKYVISGSLTVRFIVE